MTLWTPLLVIFRFSKWMKSTDNGLNLHFAYSRRLVLKFQQFLAYLKTSQILQYTVRLLLQFLCVLLRYEGVVCTYDRAVYQNMSRHRRIAVHIY